MSEEFPVGQMRAIALMLRDLEGWGTLYGTLTRFDTETGERLAEPIRTVDYYDRTPRRGLPLDWQALFVQRGWVDLVSLSNGTTAWTPTDAGRAVAEMWLPDHLKGQRP